MGRFNAQTCAIAARFTEWRIFADISRHARLASVFPISLGFLNKLDRPIIMTMPHIVAIRALTDNYIWVIRDHCHAAVVDPGDASPVLDYLRHEKLKLIAILNTHHHNDHVGGNAALLQEFTVPVYGPANESIPHCHPSS